MAESIYEKIGGSAAVSAVVADFYERVLEDASVNGYFAGIDMAALINHQTNFVAKALGGPEVYEGRDMRVAHEDRDITDAAFATIALHLQEALLGAGVGSDDTATIIGVVASLKDDVVQKPAGKLS